jgi:hypothetical protein
MELVEPVVFLGVLGLVELFCERVPLAADPPYFGLLICTNIV